MSASIGFVTPLRRALVVVLLPAFVVWATLPEAKAADNLIVAAAHGDLAAVQAQLSHGVKVDTKASDGWTALIAAADGGHIDVVEALLAKHADINAKNKDGATALMRAAWGSHFDVAQVLIAKGADVNAKTSNGRTALMAASFRGNRDVMQALIDKGADINAKTSDGRTALDAALEGGHGEVRALLGAVCTANATAPPPPPDPATLDAMIQAHIRAYFGDKTVDEDQLGIERVNGLPFDQLRYALSLAPGGAVTYVNGRAIPEQGSGIGVNFDSGALDVAAIANGEGGIAKFEKLHVADGTCLQLKVGGTYVFNGTSWSAE
jgi:hypothetical protein